MHGERRDPWFLAFAPPQQWGRRRDRRFTPSSDEAVRDRRFVQGVESRGPLDLEARRLGARLAARPRRFQALEGGPAPGGAGAALRLRRGDLGVSHGLRGSPVVASLWAPAMCCCARAAPAGRAAASARPRVARMSRAHDLAARLFGRALFALPPSALGAPCNDDGSRHRGRSSQYCERSRHGVAP